MDISEQCILVYIVTTRSIISVVFLLILGNYLIITKRKIKLRKFMIYINIIVKEPSNFVAGI